MIAPFRSYGKYGTINRVNAFLTDISGEIVKLRRLYRCSGPNRLQKTDFVSRNIYARSNSIVSQDITYLDIENVLR